MGSERLYRVVHKQRFIGGDACWVMPDGETLHSDIRKAGAWDRSKARRLVRNWEGRYGYGRGNFAVRLVKE